MLRRIVSTLLLGAAAWAAGAAPADAQQPQMNRFYYYPYYYFPHNYWPSQGPRWSEPTAAPFAKPPAYMAYPPFKEPHWRYEMWEPQLYYRGFHFWLDQF
jgi:hypothetical protein